MAIAAVNVGTIANDGTGDPLRTAFQTLNANDAELDKRVVSAAADPTVNDDTGDGYVVGSLWLNTSTGVTFEALSVGSAAAVWKPIDEYAILAANDYWTPFVHLTTNTGLSGANTLRLVAWRQKQSMVIDQLGMAMNATAATNFKGGLWLADGQVPTGNPVASIASTAAGALVTMAGLVGGGTYTLVAGRIYFWGEVHDGNLDKMTHQVSMSELFGATTTTHLHNGSGRGWFYDIAHTFATALPDLTAAGLTRRGFSAGGQGPGVPVVRVSDPTP